MDTARLKIPPYPDKADQIRLLTMVAFAQALVEQADFHNADHVATLRAWFVGIDANASTIVPTMADGAVWDAWVAEVRPLARHVLDEVTED